jgi:hypothetical protein
LAIRSRAIDPAQPDVEALVVAELADRAGESLGDLAFLGDAELLASGDELP